MEIKEKYSYSKLACFEQCPYKYKLIYVDGHFISCPSIATDFGTLIHHIEEEIGKYLQAGLKPDYKLLIADFESQVKKIEKDYPDEFYSLDKSGRNYKEKADYYKSSGIYRLENRLNQNSNLEIVGLEKEFYLDFNEYLFHGFIDRIFYDSSTNTYIIEDIKTYAQPIANKDLEAPLQHVIYSLALKGSINKDTKIQCTYDLPLCNLIQEVDPQYLQKGILELQEIFEDIKYSEFKPKPTPLCHWCLFSGTYPNQPDEAKGLCPYFSKWTKENKTMRCNYYWQGSKKHQKILESFRKDLDLD